MYITFSCCPLDDHKNHFLQVFKALLNYYLKLVSKPYTCHYSSSPSCIVTNVLLSLCFCSEHSMGEVLQYLLWTWRQQWDIHPALQNPLPSYQVRSNVKGHLSVRFGYIFSMVYYMCMYSQFLLLHIFFFFACCSPSWYKLTLEVFPNHLKSSLLLHHEIAQRQSSCFSSPSLSLSPFS